MHSWVYQDSSRFECNGAFFFFFPRLLIWWCGQLSPSWEKKTRPIHQGTTQRTGEGVRHQQIHHQGQKEKDIRADEPDRETSHDLVPEQARKGEKGCQ